ncbi:MAG TPA: hypothetical protein VMV94_05780 [Phycisphaerae bacterium]|nr:hypothetical protein [Phycisphaerae bacterium]
MIRTASSIQVRKSPARRLIRVAVGFAVATTWTIIIAGCEPAAGSSSKERSKISVIRDERPGLVRIEGIGPIRGFAKGRDNTFMHCLELVLEASGRPIGYDELMGVSGLAFRIQFRTDQWDVGSPDPLVGADCLPALFSAIGWDYETWVVRRDEISEAEALRQAVKQSIDRGTPVLAANIIPPEDWGIIVGYRPDRSWLCRSYNGGAERTDQPAKGWPTAAVILTRRLTRPDPVKAYAASIRRAIELFDKRSEGSHSLGTKAFDDWCQSLRSARDEKYVHANFWTYIGLIDARAAAVRYLRSIAKQFGPREIHLNVAADWYDKEVQLLLKQIRDVPSVRTYPDSLPPKEMRDHQIDVLRQAQIFEKNAVESLRKAL